MARAVESDRFFLFFYNKQCAYYLPKRALSNPQCAEVRALMKRAGTEGLASTISGSPAGA